jgi:hypothetical protein
MREPPAPDGAGNPAGRQCPHWPRRGFSRPRPPAGRTWPLSRPPQPPRRRRRQFRRTASRRHRSPRGSPAGPPPSADMDGADMGVRPARADYPRAQLHPDARPWLGGAAGSGALRVRRRCGFGDVAGSGGRGVAIR